ncbi:protein trichome birefringence-like [Macadamia integrifolia]|uniref:protein trichome birefringence-like n=1 Tax=Macadamia integrifolia TaxID=60698 RepID=UPI001C530743|nr:protein trichome birefringence-like [Macadamia integrifolia]
MEKNSTTPINKQWIFFTLASFLGCTLLILSLSNGRDRQNLLDLQYLRTSSALSPRSTTTTTDASKVESPRQFDGIKEEDHGNLRQKECDIFDGNWVFDDKNNTYPLYKASQCPFLSDQVNCRRNGRQDFDYEKWSWKPKKCEIPRFNGTDMLERLRGKRVIIAGDSINRNQWESLSCLLYSVVSPSEAEVNVISGVYKVFRAKDYNCSIEFYWSPFLVKLDETPTKKRRKGRRVLKLDAMASSARQWQGADIMVFNTGHWWVHDGKLQTWDFLQFKGKLVKNLEVETAFEMGMKTWAHWIDSNVNSTKTTVFFRSISPEHKLEKQWCHNQTQPILDESYTELFPRSIMGIVEKTIQEMRTPVKYLNITRLSQYRKDAHPTVYTSKQGKLLTKEQRKQPEVYGDCSHWCLPGLPDTWNVLLYALTFLENSRETL